MAYPSKPSLAALRPFKFDTKTHSQWFQRERLDAFVAEQYTAGRSLRELAELTGRTQTAIRRSLDRTGTPRRPAGAPRLKPAADN